MGVHQDPHTYQTIKTLLGIDINEEDWRQDEPIFILRAQDHLAFRTIDFYEREASNAGCGPSFLENLRRVKDAFNHFRVEHSDLMKVPD